MTLLNKLCILWPPIEPIQIKTELQVTAGLAAKSSCRERILSRPTRGTAAPQGLAPWEVTTLGIVLNPAPSLERVRFTCKKGQQVTTGPLPPTPQHPNIRGNGVIKVEATRSPNSLIKLVSADVVKSPLTHYWLERGHRDPEVTETGWVFQEKEGIRGANFPLGL